MPDRFWPHAGELPILKWDQWFSQLCDFFALTDCGLPADSRLADTEKNRYLRSLLGAEGLRQFSAHPVSGNVETASFADYSAAAKSYFGKATHEIRAHYDFHKCTQSPHQSIQEYMIQLRTLMADCQFHGRESYHLAIQLACGVHNLETQQRLLAQQNIDLDEFIRIAEADESSARDSSQIRREVQSLSIAAARNEQTNGSSEPLHCKHGCGKTGHAYKDPSCPALNRHCDNCGCRGHFASVCRKPKARVAKMLRVGSLSKDNPDPAGPRPFVCAVMLNCPNGETVALTSEVDTCSDISGITQSFYNEHFAGMPLSPAVGTICNFDLSEIVGIAGYFACSLSFCGRTASIPLHVFPDTHGHILGRDAIRALGLVLHAGHVSTSLATLALTPIPTCDRNGAEKPSPLSAFPPPAQRQATGHPVDNTARDVLIRDVVTDSTTSAPPAASHSESCLAEPQVAATTHLSIASSPD